MSSEPCPDVCLVTYESTLRCGHWSRCIPVSETLVFNGNLNSGSWRFSRGRWDQGCIVFLAMRRTFNLACVAISSEVVSSPPPTPVLSKGEQEAVVRVRVATHKGTRASVFHCVSLSVCVSHAVSLSIKWK